MSGPIFKIIQSKVEQKLSPDQVILENESHRHSVPENSETHFKLFVVSQYFEGLSRVARQRVVYQLLAEELSGSVHALSLRLLTLEEWKSLGAESMPKSPDCASGSKKDVN